MPRPPQVLWLTEPTQYADVVARWLRTHGFRLATAVSLAEAGRVVADHPADLHLIIVDDSIPAIDAAEIDHWRTAQTRRPELAETFPPIMFLRVAPPTPPASAPTDGMPASHGAVRVASKPIHGETLMAAVRQIIGPTNPAAARTPMWYSGEVLLVDREAERLDLFGEALDLEGFDITATGQITEAFSLLQHIRFDAVVADAGRMGQDGWALLKFTSSFGLAVPIVLVADSTVAEDWPEAVCAAGARGAFRRIVRTAELLACVREAVAATLDTVDDAPPGQ